MRACQRPPFAGSVEPARVPGNHASWGVLAHFSPEVSSRSEVRYGCGRGAGLRPHSLIRGRSESSGAILTSYPLRWKLGMSQPADHFRTRFGATGR